MLLRSLLLLSSASLASAFFFGCGCQQCPAPACPAAPICPPQQCVPPSYAGAPQVASGFPVSQPAQYVPVYNQASPQLVQQGPGSYATGGEIQQSAAPQAETQPTEQSTVPELSEQQLPPDVNFASDPSQGAASVKVAEVDETEAVDDKATREENKDEKMVEVADLKLTDDPLCNSDDLRALMLENIDDNLNSSKRLVQLAAEAQFGGRFDVICANGDFSYVTNTELFCQESKGDVSCYTYRQL